MLPASMFAMTVDPSGRTLRGTVRSVPLAGEYDVMVRVLACGVCRTDLHIIDGDLRNVKAFRRRLNILNTGPCIAE